MNQSQIENRHSYRFLPTYVHGVLDYLAGVILIAAPWLFGFDRGGPETWVPVALGALTIVQSLATRYELGLVKLIPMSTHLWIDGLGGALLALSPWLFGFADYVWAPHVVFGLLEIGAALTTELTPRQLPEHRRLRHAKF